MGAQLQDLPVAKIDPSPFQTRTFTGADPELGELATSIEKVGVLEPVIVRAKGKRFEIVAGERRVRASKLAKLESVPAIVRDLDDDQAMEITCIENLQRKDLHPLHEGAAIAMLCDRAGWTQQTVAEHVGRPLSYVARRARLMTLTKKWQKVLTDPEHPAAGWSASHMGAVANLEPADQDDFLETLTGASTRWNNAWAVSAARLREEVERDYLLQIHSAPWKPSDAELLPAAGACTACPSRASANPGLFDDVGSNGSIPKNDRCLSVRCWNRKMDAFKKRSLEEARTEHGKTIPVLVEQRPYGEKFRRHEVEGYHYDVSKKPKPGFKPAIEMRRRESNFGQVVFAKHCNPYGQSSGSGKKKAADMTAAEKLRAGKDRLERRRARRCIELAFEAVKGSKPPKATELLALSALLGTSHRRACMGWGLEPCGPLPKPLGKKGVWAIMEKLDAGVSTALRAHLWGEQLVPLFESRWTYGGSYTAVDAQWRDAQGLCQLLGIDAAAIRASVEQEIPEPKSWAKLRLQAKQDKAARRKKKAA